MCGTDGRTADPGLPIGRHAATPAVLSPHPGLAMIASGRPDDLAIDERPLLLVVDDEEDVRFAMQFYFGARGYRVETAATFTEALDAFARTRPSAIISDLRLGGSDGEEGLALLRVVRAARRELPFVLVTGYGTPAVVAEARRLGASAVLIKPEPLADIASVVRTLLAAPPDAPAIPLPIRSLPC